MKNIAIFLLVGLGLFSSGYGIDLDMDKLGLDIKKCLSSLEKSDELLTSLAGNVCKSRHEESELDKVTKSVETTITFLDDHKCLPEPLRGLEIAEMAKEKLDELKELLKRIVSDEIAVLEPAMDKVCEMLDPVWRAKCLHELIQTLKDILTHWKCQPGDSQNIDLKMKKLLGKLQCSIAELIKDLKILPEETVKSVNKILSFVIDSILNELSNHFGNDIICTVDNVLSVANL
ncbi:uncharacterized protein [Dendrobates tinctorius]|uniref:uncharacterized protein isoform X2 n=1 Tax=Dendrobates tinctorius TaxID=92724 RepID=UPI003CC9A9D4